jgi:hypothetical protein
MRRMLVGLVLLIGCGDPPATTTSTSAPAPASQAAASAKATAAVATISASATTSAPVAFEESAEPELKEWATSKIVKVPGSTKNSCETRMVREWLRVMCVNRSAERGTPKLVTIQRGRPGKGHKGENLKVVNDTTMLLVPVRPGTDFAATFEWENGSDELVVKWPAGTPESQRKMTFASGKEQAAPSDAAPSDAAGPPPDIVQPSPVAEPKTEPPLDDIATISAKPSDDEWKAAKEVGVKGSSAAGCETKVVGEWFRARCEGKEMALAFSEIEPLKGHRKTQTAVTIDGTTATLVTPYVEGTEMHARFASSTARYVLVLRWTKGPKPASAGAFEAIK